MIIQSLTYLTLAVALGCAPAIQAQPANLDPANPAGPAARLPDVSADLALNTAGPTEQAPPVSPAAAEDKAPQQFTCPMHPEVTSNEPGRCPKCNMKLVPKKKDDEKKKEEGHEHHQKHSEHHHE